MEANTKQPSKYRPKGIKKQKIIDMAIANPNLSHGQIADLTDLSRGRVSQILGEYHVCAETAQNYADNEAILLRDLRRRIYNQITDKKLESAPMQNLMVGMAIAIEKDRLISGQSTSHIVSLHADLAAIKQARSNTLVANKPKDEE